MHDAAPLIRLRLRYKEPEELSAIDPGWDLLAFFADYYEADKDTLGATIEQRRIDRILAYAQNLPEPVLERSIVESLVKSDAIPYNESEQYIINLHSAIMWLEKQDKPLNFIMLTQVHKMLLSASPNAHLGGALRTDGRDLFAFIDSGALLPAGDELKTCLKDVFNLLVNENIHPLTRAFLYYYVMHATQPFTEENETIAILTTHYFLAQNGFSLLGLLNLEKHIFFDEIYKLQMAHLLDEHNYLELLDADLTAYLGICVHRFNAHISEVKKVLVGVIKELFGFPDFTPRQKNGLNFWLSKGFFIQHEKLHALTPRQHDIMMLLVKYGSVTNKDLVPIFQVDRKTLQRDFTTLVDLELAEQRGMGRAVRYHVNFRVPLT